MDQPTINIGCLGHVSHGKSTIVKVLSNTATGRFQNEKKRNMTIKLGYANIKIFQCPTCPEPRCYQSTNSSCIELICKHCQSPTQLIRHFSFVDAPGHHELITTMVSGSCILDGVLLVIASNETCPSPQTEEHYELVKNKAFAKNLIVVQNKLDLVSKEDAVKNKNQILNFLGCTRLAHSHRQDQQDQQDQDQEQEQEQIIIPVSAVKKLNLDLICQSLVKNIPIPERDLKLNPKMNIVRSFDINKPGTLIKNLEGGVVGGSLVQGVLKPNDLVTLSPLNIQARIISLYSDETKLESAIPGGLIAVQLDINPCLAKNNKLVGQILGDPVRSAKKMKLKLTKILSNLKKNDNISICVNSDKVNAKIIRIRNDEIRVILERKICAEYDLEVIIFKNNLLSAFGKIKQCYETEEQKSESWEKIIKPERKIKEIKEYPEDEHFFENLPEEDNLFYGEKYPEENEIVVAKVTKIDNNTGVYCELLEYDNVVGLITTRDLSSKRLRSIKQVVSINKLEVVNIIRVDSEKGYIDLSLKDVRPEEKIEYFEKFQKYKRFHSILKSIAFKIKVPRRHVYNKFGDDLYENYNDPLDALKLASTNFEHVFNKYGLPDRVSIEIRKILKQKFGNTVELSVSLEIRGDLKDLREIQENIYVKAPPEYTLTVSGKTREEAIDRVYDICIGLQDRVNIKILENLE